jgi:hypothetical protein
VRVVPDYHGRWGGGLRVTSCTETGVFAEFDFCDEAPVGTTYGYSLTLSQTGEAMTAVVDYGESAVFPSIAAPIRDDGVSVFSPTISFTDSGVTLFVDAAFTINSTRVGELTGTVNEVWRFPNVNGEGRIMEEIVATTRSSTTSVSTMSEGTGRRLRALRRVMARHR